MNPSRRKSIKNLTIGLAGIPVMASGIAPILQACSSPAKQANEAGTETLAPLFFSISLAQWSLNRSFFGKSREQGWEYFGKMLQTDPAGLLQGKLNPIDFPVIASKEFGIKAVEYVNTLFYDKSEDTAYLNELKTRCDGEGVKSLLIMCDAEGNLGDLDEGARIKAVENHYKWINAAKYLDCHSIRVNAAGNGTAEEVRDAAIDGLGRLTEYAAQNGINVIVENHGGYSSDGQWLASVMQGVGSDYCGTLPDFGNFCIQSGAEGCAKEYDRYKGMEELMPFAKGVSAKAYEFDAEGNETKIDFKRILGIVKQAGFTGHIGIEYEGDNLSEKDGIRATKALLEKAGAQV